MTSSNDQETNRPPNYADQLKRVRQVKRTLDDATIQNISSGQVPGQGREHVSHESLKDQAISRKTRRPAEDYEVAKNLFSGEALAQSHAPVPPVPQPVAQPALSPPPSSPPPPAAQKPPAAPSPLTEDQSFRQRPSQQFVSKTLLDHNAILRAQLLRQKERAEKVMASRLPVKPLEPVQAQKQVRACPFSWKRDYADERFKACSKCQSTLYDFEGIDLADAEKLIFQRENLKKFVLYKRPDGKFMTSDCPIEMKRKQQKIAVIALCVVLVVAVGALLIFMPPTSSPGLENSLSAPAPDTVSTKSPTPDSVSSESAATSSGGTRSSGTAIHYEAGDPMPTEAAPRGASTTTEEQKTYTESEEKGDFWEFSGQ